MNNTQVAKVVHEATRALDETQAAAAQPKWEELNDQARSEKAAEVGGHYSGIKKGVSADQVAQSLPQNERLKTYVASGIVNAFAQYDEAQSKTGVSSNANTTLDREQGSNKEQVAQPNVDTIRQENALHRANAPEPPAADAKDVHEALARADASLAKAGE